MTEVSSETSYLSKTVVQPKPVVEALTHHGTECSSIIKAFSATAFSGIRSLPNNIHPDFRQRILMETLESTKGEKSGRLTRNLSPPKEKSQAASKIPKGQRRRQKYGGMPQTFTSYEYMSDPVQDKLAKRRDEISKGKEKWLSTDDFKTCALPQVDTSQGLFNKYTYSISPYENTEEEAKRENKETKQKILHGPVRAGGCVNQAEQARIRLKELLKSIMELLKGDWPDASIDAFVDETGCIVLSFLKKGQSLKHVIAYMNRFAKGNSSVREFHLKKDATRWPYTNDDMENAFFVLQPPWIHVKPELNKKLHGQRGVKDTSYELPLDSGRIPFGPQSINGNPIQIHVRNLNLSFNI